MEKKLEKYKEWSLKSGFPLENDTLISINEVLPTSKIQRNLEFTTINENQRPCIRSVDFLVTVSKNARNIPHTSWTRSKNETVEINFIIDCKYTSDESFLFIPSTLRGTNLERWWPCLIPSLRKNSYGDAINLHRSDLLSLAIHNSVLKVAGVGRKVKEQTKERDTLSDSIVQIVEGLTHVFQTKANSLGSISTEDSSYARNAYYFIPIIVTNAPLLLLHEQINESQVNNAARKEDLFQSLDSILVDLPNIYDLKNSWSSLEESLRSLNNNLSWYKDGVGAGHALFCNLEGLNHFLRDINKKFENLSMEPEQIFS